MAYLSKAETSVLALVLAAGNFLSSLEDTRIAAKPIAVDWDDERYRLLCKLEDAYERVEEAAKAGGVA
jgi:hypothetical protein